MSSLVSDPGLNHCPKSRSKFKSPSSHSRFRFPKKGSSSGIKVPGILDSLPRRFNPGTSGGEASAGFTVGVGKDAGSSASTLKSGMRGASGTWTNGGCGGVENGGVFTGVLASD